MTSIPSPQTGAPEASDHDAPLTRLTATDMARLVRDRELDAVDLLEAHLRRIEVLDPKLHAFAAVLTASAREEALALRRRHDLQTLPLAGVPVAVKDNVDIAGEPTTYGSAATSRTPAQVDDLLVRRLRGAGAVVIGRTIMPELAIWPFTEPEAFPAPRNPWNPERTPGGSTGGGAVAVASRMAALAVGSDGGGSIRIPAACCGLVGVKTAPGVVPVPGPGGVHWYGLTAFGPLARGVADAALMLDVMAGTTSYRDPVPPRRQLRIAVSARHPVFGSRLSRDCRDGLDATAAALAGAGHAIDQADPPYPLTPAQFSSRWLAGIAQDAEGLDPAKLESRTRGLVKRGQRAQRRVRPASTSRFSGRMQEWFVRCDLLITPVLASPAVPIGQWSGRGWLSTMLSIGRWMGYANNWNVAGVAAIAIPAGMSTSGLPVAVQLIGPAGSEPLLLSVAAQLEELRPWPGGPEQVAF